MAMRFFKKCLLCFFLCSVGIYAEAPSITTINGDYTQSASTTLNIELAGTDNSSEVQFEQLQVFGDISLAGTLNITLTKNSSSVDFVPTANDSFKIISWNGTLSGTFDHIVYPSIASDIDWNIDDLYTNGVLRVVFNDLPVADALTVSENEDTDMTVELSATDNNGYTLSYEIVSNPSIGTLSLSGSTVTYTPSTNYTGLDEFTYRVTNEYGYVSSIATASLTVESVIDDFVLSDKIIAGTEDVNMSITLDGDTLEGRPIVEYTILTSPSHANFPGSGNSYTYKPDDDFSGTDSFTYQAKTYGINNNNDVYFPATGTQTMEDVHADADGVFIAHFNVGLTYLEIDDLSDLSDITSYNKDPGGTIRFVSIDKIEGSNKVYISSLTQGVFIYQINDSGTKITEVDSLDEAAVGYSDFVRIDENETYMYTVDHNAHFSVFDVTGGTITYKLTSSTISNVRSLDVNNDRVYVVARATSPANGLKIYDYDGDTTLTLRGSTLEGVNANRIIVDGNYAYIGCWNEDYGFRVVDISDPDNPVQVGQVSLGSSSQVTDMYKKGDVLFVKESAEDYIYMVNVEDPTFPKVVYQSSNSPTQTNFGMDSTNMYMVQDTQQKVRIYPFKSNDSETSQATVTINIPQDYLDGPSLETSFPDRGYRYQADPINLNLESYFGNPESDTISYSVSNSDSTVVASAAVSGTSLQYSLANKTGSSTLEVEAEGAEAGSELTVTDSFVVSVFKTPVLTVSSESVTTSEDVSIDIDFDAVFSPLEVSINYTFISGPANGTMSSTGIEHRYTYTPDDDFNGTEEFSFQAISSESVSIFDENAGLTDLRYIQVSANYAYVSDYGVDVKIYDVSDPWDPQRVATLNNTDKVTETFIQGDYLYMSVGRSGSGSYSFQIWDVSDPTSPTLTGNTRRVSAESIFVEGNYAYVGSSGALKVSDISDPSAISSATEYTDSSSTSIEDIFIDGNVGYFAEDDAFIIVPDLATLLSNDTDLDNETVIDAVADLSANTGDNVDAFYQAVTDVFVSGDYAYLGAGSYGFAILDVSTPSAPEEVYVEDLSADVNSVYVFGTVLYIVTDTAIRSYNITDPTNPELRENYTGLPGSSLEAMAMDSDQVGYVVDNARGLLTFVPKRNSSTVTLSITIESVEDVPEFTSGTEFEVSENLTAVGTMTATDAENDTVTFSITGGLDSALFTINESTGALAFDEAPRYLSPADNGENNVYDLIIGAHDAQGYATQSITVTVNQVPQVLVSGNGFDDLEVNEDAGDYSILLSEVFNYSGYDVSYNLTINSNQDLVTTNIGSAEISVNYLILDFLEDQNGTANIEIRAYINVNDVESAVTDSFIVTVNAVIDDLTIDTGLSDVDADEDDTDLVIDISGVFAHDGGTFNYVLSSNTNDSLVTTSIDSDAETLSLDFLDDQNGTANITLSAVADGDSISDSFFVTVNAVNDAPVPSNIPGLTVSEDSDDETVTLSDYFSDVDAGDTLVYTVSSNSNEDLITASILSDVLTLEFAADLSGTANILISATDGTSTVNSSLFVTVNAVNDAPTFSVSLADDVIRMNSIGVTTSIAATDIEGDSLSYTLSSNPQNIVSLSNDGDVLTITPITNAIGDTVITVVVNDTGALKSTVNMTMTVASYNLLTVSDVSTDVDEDNDVAVSISDAVSWKDSDIEYSIVSAPSNGSITGTAPNYTYSPDEHFNGTDTFTVAVDQPMRDIYVNGSGAETPVASHDTSYTFDDIYVTNNHVYITNYYSDERLYIYDHTDPDTLELLGSKSVSDMVNMLIYKHYLFALRDSGTDTIRVYDISDPNSIGDPVSELNVPNGTNSEFWDIQGNYLYVGGQKELNIVDISDPTNLSLASDNISLNLDYSMTSLLVHDDIIYFGGYGNADSNVTRYSLSNDPLVPLSKEELATDVTTDTLGSTVDMFVSDGYLYLLDDENGAHIIEIDSFAFVEEKQDRGKDFREIFVYNQYMYYGEDNGEVHVYDITDKSNASYEESWDLAGGGLNWTAGIGMYIYDGYFYYLDRTNGLSVFPVPERILSQVTITINSIEDLPTVSTALADIEVDEDSAVSTFNIDDYITDGDLAYGDSLSYSVTYNNETMLDIEISGSLVTINYLLNQNGLTTVTINVEDNDGDAVSDAFTVTVNPVDDSPVLASAIEDITKNMNASDVTIDLNTVFTDVDSDLSFLVSSNSNTDLLSATISEDEELLLSFETNEVGFADLVISATGSGVTINDSFRVVVGENDNLPPVIDNPLADKIFLEDGVVTASMVGVFDDLNSGDTLSYTAAVVQNSQLLSVSVDASVLTLNASEDAFGLAVVEVYASDGSFTTTDSITVTVSAVNDAPVFSTGETMTVTENLSTMATIEVVDVDDNSLTYSIVSNGSDDSALFSIDSSTGVLTASTAFNYESPIDGNEDNDYSFVLSVADNEYTVTQSLTISISDDNDAPSINVVIADDVIRMNSASITKSIGVVEQDDGDSLSYSISSSPANILTLTNSGDTLTITPIENKYGIVMVTVNVTDELNASTEVTFNMHVASYNFVTVSDQAVETEEEDAVAVTLSDAVSWSGDSLGYEVITSPSHGTVTGSGGSYTYTPTDNYVGTDSFTVSVETPVTAYSPSDVSVTNDDLDYLMAVYVTNNLVFLGSSSATEGDAAGIKILTHVDPSTLTEKASLTEATRVREMMVIDNYLFVLRAITTETIQVYDISDLSNIGPAVSTINVNNSNSTDAWAVSGNYLFVGGGSKLSIIDISNPRDIDFVSDDTELITVKGFHKMVVHNGYLYLSRYYTGSWDAITRYSISDSFSLSSAEELRYTVSGEETKYHNYDLIANGRYIYLLNHERGIYVVDTESSDFTDESTIVQAKLEGSSNPGADYYSLKQYKQYVYAQQDVGEIQVWDATDPSQLEYVSELDVSGGNAGRDITISDGYLYYAGYSSGLSVVPISERALSRVTVTINNASDGPELLQSFSDIEVDEDSTAVTFNLSEYFTDPDIDYGDSLTYSIATTNTGLLLDIEQSGELVTINFLSQLSGTDNITITAQDQSSNSVSDSFFVTVNAVNDAPVISGTPDDEVDEDVAYSFVPTVTDADDNDHVFSILNKPSWASFDTATGELSGSPDNDETGFYSNIEIGVSDDDVTVSLNAFSITVNAIDDAPTVIDPGFEDYVVAEDAAAITINLTTIFEDIDSDLSFVVTSNSNGSVVTTSIGELILTLNFVENASGTAVIEVEASADGKSVTDSFIVTVNAENDVPIISGTPDDEVDEDTAYSFVPTVTDADDSDHVFSVLNKPSWASFDIATGELSGTPDNDETGVYSNIEIGVSDDDVTVSLNVFSITVNAIDDAPVVIDPGFEDLIVNEDADPVTVNLTSIFEDVDSDLSYVVTSNSSGLVVTTSIENSILTLNFLEDAFGTAVIEVEASADGKSVTDSFIVTVNEANDAPEISGTPDDEVDEDQAYSFTPTASDADGDTLVFSILNQPSWADFNTGTGELSGAPDNGDTGLYSNIEIGVSDDDVTVSLNSFSITVNGVDDAPTVIDPGFEDLIVNEDADSVTVNLASIFEDDDSDLSYVVTSNSSGLVVTTSIETSILTLNFLENAFGTAVIEVEAFADGKSVTDSFIVTVNAVNDAPVISGTPDDEVAEDNAYSFVPTSSDVDDNTVVFSILNKPSWASFDTGSGELSGTPGNDDIGYYADIEIGVSDDDVTVSLNAFGITVNAEDDAPVVIDPGFEDLTVSEDATAVTINLLSIFEDVDSDLSFVVTGTTNGLVVTTSIGESILTLNFVENSFGIAVIEVEASADGQSVTDSFIVTVNAINDAPLISGTPDDTVDEDVAYSFTPTVSDVDDNSLVFSIQNKPSWADFNSGTGQLSGSPGNSDTGYYGSIEIGVSDDDVTVSLNAFGITVNAVDDGPSIVDPGFEDLIVNEDADPVTINVSSIFEDIDSNDLAFVVTSNSNASVVGTRLDSTVLTLNFLENAYGVAIISVEARADGQAITDSFIVTVNAVDDAPVVINSGFEDRRVSEDETAIAIDLTTIFEDIDSNLSYVVTGNSAGLVVTTSIDAAVMTLNFVEDANGEAVIEVEARGDGQFVTDSITVTVEAVDDAPRVIGAGLTDKTVLEGASDYVKDLSTIFEDIDSNSLVFTIESETDTDVVRSTISGDQFTAEFLADQFGSSNIVIKATADGKFVTDNIILTVSNVNDLPEIESADSVSVSENRTAVMTIIGTDLESETVTYSITGGVDSASFELDESTGELTFVEAPDYEVDSTEYVVEVGVGDGQVTVTQAITVTVVDVNESPELVQSLLALSVLEDASPSTVNMSQFFTDPEDNISSYLVTGISGTDFVELVTENAVLTVNYVEDENGAVELEIRASDGEFFATASVTITINAVNDAPVISGSPDDEVTEDSAYSFVPTATDVDDSDLSFAIENMPSWADFDTETGELSGTPGNDDAGNYGAIIIGVSDGELSVSLNAFSITVNAEDDSPTVIDPGFEDLTVSEDATAIAVNLSTIFEDQDSDLSYLLVSNSSGSVVTTNIEDAVLTLNFIENAFGVAVIEVSATGDGQSVTDSFVVTVNAVNDAPVISGTPDDAVTEDSAYSFVPTATDVDDSDLSFAIENMPSWADFDTETGELSGTPGNDDAGSYSAIIIGVSDGELSVSLNAFSITVNPEDDSPTVIDPGFEDLTVSEDATAITVNLSTIFEDQDSDLSYLLVSNSSGFVVTTNIEDAVLTLNFIENAFGVAVIEVSATGDGQSVTDSFVVTVNAVNDAPVISGTPDDEVNEDAVYSFEPAVSDVDDTEHVFSIVNKPSWASFDSATGELTGTPDNDDVDVYSGIEIGVSDDDVTVSLNSFSITVNAMDDGPVLIDPGFEDLIVSEDADLLTINLLSIFEDSDSDLSFDLGSNSNDSVVNTSISDSVLTLSFVENAFGVAVIEIEAEGDGSTVTDSFTVTVNAVDDPTELVDSGVEDMVVSEDADLLTVDLSSVFFDVDSDLSYLVSSNSNSSIVSASIVDEELRLEFIKDAFGVSRIRLKAIGDGRPVIDAFVVTVNSVDDSPVIIGDGFEELIVSEDADAVTVNLLTVFDDLDSELSFLLDHNSDEAVVSASLDDEVLTVEFLENAFGSSSLTITAIGDQQSVSDSFVITVNGVNDFPIIEGVAESIATEDLSYSFRPTATDVDGDDLIFSVDNLPDWASFSTENGVLTGLPVQLDVGDYDDILISVSDGLVDVSLATFSISVIEVNEAPSVTGNPDLEVDQGQLYRFVPEANDEEGDDLVFSIENKPSWLSFNTSTGELVGTANSDDVGVYTDIVLSVSDAEFTVSLSAFSITVNQVDKAPVVLGDGFEDVSVDEDAEPVTVNLSSVFSDPDGDTLSIDVIGNSNSSLLSANIEESILTLTFEDNQHGVATLLVAATAKQKVVTDSFVVTVSDQNDVPVFVSTSNATVTSNQKSVQSTLSVTDIDGDTIEFSLEGGVDEDLFEINSNTGSLSTLVTLNYLSHLDSDQDGVYEIYLGASDGTVLVTTAIEVRVVVDGSGSETVVISDDTVLTDYVDITETELVVNQESILTFEEGAGVVSSSITLVSSELYSEGITINNTEVSLDLGSTLSSNILILESTLTVEQDKDSLITAVDVIGDYLLVVDGGTGAFGTIEGDVLITGNGTLMESDLVSDIDIEGSLTLDNSTLYVDLTSTVIIDEVLNITNSHLIVTWSLLVSSEVSASFVNSGIQSKVFSQISFNEENRLSEGDSFEILSVETIEGTFSTVTLPELDSNLEWDLSNLYKTGIVEVVSSVEEPSPWADYFLAYPNPMSLLDGNSVDIGFNVESDGYVTVFIYNMLGHLMVEKVAYVSPDEYNRVSINESDFLGGELSAGVYFFVIQSGDQILGRGKFGVTP